MLSSPKTEEQRLWPELKEEVGGRGSTPKPPVRGSAPQDVDFGKAATPARGSPGSSLTRQICPTSTGRHRETATVIARGWRRHGSEQIETEAKLPHGSLTNCKEPPQPRCPQLPRHPRSCGRPPTCTRRRGRHRPRSLPREPRPSIRDGAARSPPPPSLGRRTHTAEPLWQRRREGRGGRETRRRR